MTKHLEGSVIVWIRTSYVTMLLLAGGAAVAIAAAPGAAASPDGQPCSDMGGSTQCERTGNVQIFTKAHDMPVSARAAYGPFEGYHAGHN
jgi:hypothetical protein